MITSNLWILTSTPVTQGSTITMICPDKATSSMLFQQPFHILKLPSAFSVMSRHFHLPPTLQRLCGNNAHISLQSKSQYNQYLNSRFLHMATFDSNWTTAHMQKLADVPKVPVAQLYKHMIGQNEPHLSSEINSNMEEEPSFTWQLLKLPT